MPRTEPCLFETARGLRTLTTAQWIAVRNEAIVWAREERRRAMQALILAALRSVRRLRRRTMAWIARQGQAQMVAQRQWRNVLGFAGVDRAARLH